MCKRVVCLTFLSVLALAQVAPADLVGWWKLDDGTGTAVKDSSGNGIDGAFVGSPKWAAGMNGTGALELDGASWVDFGAPPKTLFTGTMPLSIALWIYPTNLGTVLAGSGHDRAFVARNQDYAFKASGPYARLTTPGVLDYNAQKTVLKVGEWQHVAVTFQPGSGVPGVAVFYLDGVETDRVSSGAANGGYNTAAATAGTTAAGGPFLIGMNQWATNQMYFGRYDDIRLYDHILTADEVKQLAFRANAYKPSPADKAIAVSQPLFQWQPGSSALFHNVYLGTSPELTAADLAGPNLPFTMFYFTAGLEPGATYYWRVDEVEANGTVYTGDVWSFTATPKAAWAQKPAEGSSYMAPTTALEWAAGLNAVTHDVYLGTDRAAVEAGAPEARKAEKLATTTYSAAGLENGKTYYWRVDEVLADGSKVTGPVWSFTVRPVIAKTDPSLLAWWKLDDEKSPFVVDYSGNDYYGTLQGNPQWVDGYLGGALQFNGSTSYVDFGTPAALYQPKAYTYCAWFKVARDIAGNSGAQYLLCLGSRSDLVFGVEDAVGVNGDLSLHYYDTAPGFHAVSVGQTVWRADEWHMVAATKDATGHKIYLDGVLKNSDNNTLDDNYNTTRMISLGARGWTNPKIAFFNGAIDDVRIYNRALTADEIQQTMRGDLSLAWNAQPPSSATVDFREATSLSWSAGDKAARHDVYFAKDKEAVRTADTAAPVYQGRQAGTSFDLTGRVELGGGAYFWRIDEVEADGATIHKGAVWTFTIPGYLIVDEFEGYNDDMDAKTTIFDTWIDGLTDGRSGSVVGHSQAPFAEQTIVHSGRQSMPMDYGNAKAPFFSEAVQEFAPQQDWTVGGVESLSLWFRGQLATAALVETVPGQYQIGATSNDVWGTADSFRFYYKTLTGDGSITAKVIGVTNTSTNWAKAGVMIRDSLEPGSTYGFMFPTPDRRRAFQNRPLADAGAVSAHSNTNAFTAFPFWVRVERMGNQITAYYSTDGKTWTRQPDNENTGADRSLNPQMVTMGSSVLVGLAVASNNFGARTAYGEFSDVTTTGSVSGSWQLVDVGTKYSNDPDKLYVAVEDSAGKSAVVTHADPAAVGLTTWTEWKIPLSSLTGVNLARVKKLYLGVGDRKATAATGSGRVYLDDIRVTKP